MPAVILILLFIVVPIVELAVIIEVGQALGVLPTIALLIAASVLGGLLLRSQGRLAWRRLNDAMAEGRVPHREALDGALILFGGALLLTPGFISDAFGVLLLAPPSRAVARRVLVALIARRFFVGMAALRWLGSRRPGGGRPQRDYDVEGTATDAGGSSTGASGSSTGASGSSTGAGGSAAGQPDDASRRRIER